jgi:hypothetical protein
VEDTTDSRGIPRKPRARHGIADQVPPLFIVRTKVEGVVVAPRTEHQRNAPEMILAVINTDGEHRPVALDSAPRADERVGFSAFDVEFEKRRVRIADQHIDRLGGNSDRP